MIGKHLQWLRLGGHGTVVSRKRKIVALFVAGFSDLVQITLFPLFFEGAASPFDLILDVLTAGALFATLGFKWRLLFAFLLELVPGFDLFPTWTAFVFSLHAEPPASGARIVEGTIEKVPPITVSPGRAS